MLTVVPADVLAPSMWTWRSATFSVVNVREPLDSLTTSSRCRVIGVLRTPPMDDSPVTLWPLQPSVTLYVLLSLSPEQVTTCAPRSAVQVGKPVGLNPATNGPARSPSRARRPGR